MARRHWLFLALLALPIAPYPATAVADETGVTGITVTAPQLERPVEEIPAAVTRLEEEELEPARSGRTLDEVLEAVPGVRFDNRYNFAQGVRVSSRGFGARAAFGIRGLRLQVDGVPLTLPDGQSQVDAVDLDSVIASEVRRGPASVLHGNATGGILDLQTAEGFTGPDGARLTLQGGSHGFRKAYLRAAGAGDGGAWHAAVSDLSQEGHRDQSAVDKRLVRLSTTRLLEAGRELRLIVGAMDTPFAEDPGGLTREEMERDPGMADPDAVTLDAGQRVDQQDVAAIWRDPASLPGEVTARLFASRRDFQQQLPFYFEVAGEPAAENRVGYRRLFYGARLAWSREGRWAGRPVDGLVGLDVDRQADNRERHVVDETRTVREQTVDERQTATSTGLFGRLGMAAGEATGIILGLRLDRLRLAVDDRLPEPADDSGSRTFAEVSGGLGLTRAVGEQTLYANLTTAFESPTFVELADPDGGGGMNPDLEPQRAVNREVGARGPLGDTARWELALYSVRVRNELIPFERAGRDFYENAGSTRREGVEAGLDWASSGGWSLRAAFTAADYRFVDFEDREGNDYGGNELPGLARWHGELVARRDLGPGGVALAVRNQGRRFADNANEVRVAPRTVADLRAHWRRGGWRLFAAVENLADADYPANIRVNNGPGYFEPAPGRTLRLGLAIPLR